MLVAGVKVVVPAFSTCTWPIDAGLMTSVANGAELEDPGLVVVVVVEPWPPLAGLLAAATAGAASATPPATASANAQRRRGFRKMRHFTGYGAARAGHAG